MIFNVSTYTALDKSKKYESHRFDELTRVYLLTNSVVLVAVLKGVHLEQDEIMLLNKFRVIDLDFKNNRRSH